MHAHKGIILLFSEILPQSIAEALSWCGGLNVQPNLMRFTDTCAVYCRVPALLIAVQYAGASRVLFAKKLR